jgi:hypothetical protein
MGSDDAHYLHAVAAQLRIELCGRLWHGRLVR